MSYHYNISRLDAGSAKYGPCEICGGHCDTSYYQTESEEFEILPPGSNETVISLTRYNCVDYIGHKQCLINRQWPNR